MSKPESAAVRAGVQILLHLNGSFTLPKAQELAAIIEAEIAAEQPGWKPDLLATETQLPVSQEPRCPECSHGKEWLLDGVCRANVCSISTHGICGHRCEEVPTPVPQKLEEKI